MSAEQDYLLSKIDDPKVAKIMSDIWKQIEGEPFTAARLIRSLGAVKAALNETLTDLPEQWEKFEAEMTKADLRRVGFLQDIRDLRAGTLMEMAAALKDLKEVQDFFVKLDDDKFLNKANRLLEICNKLATAKRDGTFDLLKKLL